MEAFDIIKTVIINNRQDESQACYWDLYISNSPTVAKRADKAATNYHAAGLEESLECLRVQMEALQYAGMKYFIVVLKTSANAPQGNPIPAPNGAYKGYTPGIGSVNMQQNQQNQLLALQQQMHQMQIEHIREMNRIEMERLKEDLEGALNHKEKAIDKFLDFLDRPAFKPVIAGLVQRMSGAPAATPSIANTPPMAPPPAAIEQNVADNATDIDQEQEMQQAQQLMAESMHKIDRVFPGETLVFIQELAAYVEANPDMAKSVRQMIKTPESNA